MIPTPGQTFNNGSDPQPPTTTVHTALQWLRERCDVDAKAAFSDPADTRHLLAVLLVDQARAVIDATVAAGRSARGVLAASAVLAKAVDHDQIGHGEAATAREDARIGAGVLEGRLADYGAAEDALGRLAAAWRFAVAARVAADFCTHSAGCEVHPKVDGLHNYDPAWC